MSDADVSSLSQSPPSPEQAARGLVDATAPAIQHINGFTKEALHTRGGRIGSGMGTLLEGLWGFYINGVLRERTDALNQCEIGWLADNEYNDFACIHRDQEWNPAKRVGEFLRIEAKSMNSDAGESKAHFDEIIENLGRADLLVVLVWHWAPVDPNDARAYPRVYPRIRDYFIGRARSVATIRDELHLARGGSFVDRDNCPDGCDPEACRHHGEPLNAKGKRERLSGPASRRPSQKLSHSANFGGLVRMMKVRGRPAKQVLAVEQAADPVADAYARFIVRNFGSSPELAETADVVPVDPTAPPPASEANASDAQHPLLFSSAEVKAETETGQ